MRVVTVDRQPLVRAVAELFHDLAGLGAVLLHIGAVARAACCSTSGGMPQLPAGGGIIAPPIEPSPSLMMSMKALRSSVSTIGAAQFGVVEGRLRRG